MRSFILDTLKRYVDEKTDAAYWDMYLVYLQRDEKADKSFDDWKRRVQKSAEKSDSTPSEHKVKDQAKIDEGIKKSFSILKGFKPS